MATSSPVNPTAAEDGHFDDGLQALTFAEDWSNLFSPSTPLLQMPTGPLDLELVAFNSMLSSVYTQSFNNAPSPEHDQNFDRDTDWERREDFIVRAPSLRIHECLSLPIDENSLTTWYRIIINSCQL